MPTLNVKANFKGPMFNPATRARVRTEVVGMVADVTEAGTNHLMEMLRVRPAGVFLSVSQARPGQASTGHYAANLHGRSRNLQGRIDDGGVVYGAWLEGTSQRNQTTRFKGYASFRRTRQWMNKNLQRIIRPRVARMVRVMGGRV